MFFTRLIVAAVVTIVAAGGFQSTLAAPTSDTLMNLVRWEEAEGGNGHWYAVLTGERYWVEAHERAGEFELEGMTGYLATVTSPEENEFILNHVIAGTDQPSILDMFWLDGRDIGGRWMWLTGEPFVYVNWSIGEPNNVGIETALGMWGHNQTDWRRIPGMWNNSLPDSTVNPLARFWSLVEWGAPDTTTPPPPPDTLINLVQWRTEEGGNGHWYAVLARPLYWVEAHSAAATFEHEGRFGYLATITSPGENAFILSHVVAGTYQPSILDLFWLDGRDIDGTWQWLTDEAFAYTNWAPGEPNNPGIETALSFWGPRALTYGGVPGMWNNALPDDAINSLHRWWSVVEWGDPDTSVVPPPPPDTVINLVQWSGAEGGNDHWYAVLTGERYWVEAAAAAGTLEHEGMTAYLATVTSPAENDFILWQVIAGTHQPSVLDMFWLGGRDINGWLWTTAEPFVYTNWSLGEPNNVGIETALGMWGHNQTDPRRIPGMWNNSLPDGTINPYARFWTLVEWGEPDTTLPPPVCGNGVIEPGETCDDGNLVAGDGCDPLCQIEPATGIRLLVSTDSGNGTLMVGVPASIIFSVIAPEDVQIAAVACPLVYQFSNGNLIGPVSDAPAGGAWVTFSAKAASAFEVLAWNEEYGLAATDPDTTLAGLIDFDGYGWSGSGELWRLTFVPQDTGTILIDSVTMPTGVPLEVMDPYAHNVPFTWDPAVIHVVAGLPTGDVDGSSSISSSDLVYLVNYLFKSGPAPLPCAACGDVDCSGTIAAPDLIGLVNYIFKGGVAPCNVGDLTEAGVWTCP